MPITSQISSSLCGEPELAPLFNGYIGDDWVWNFLFKTSDGAIQNMSAFTFTAELITQSGTRTAVTGVVGSVNATLSASGSVTVTVTDGYTSSLTPDITSVDVPYDQTLTYYYRLHLITTDTANNTLTRVIIPIRKVRP